MLVVGAGGFAKELAEVLLQIDGLGEVVFYDDLSRDVDKLFLDRFEIIRNYEDANKYFAQIDRRFVVGVGTPAFRKSLFEKFLDLGGEPSTIISPRSIVGRCSNSIGDGTLILSNTVVESSNSIGKNVLLHVASLVSHDVQIGDHCEISPGAVLLGGTSVGECSSLGAGCVVLPRIRVGSNVVVGAGAVVTKNIMDNTTVVGVPAASIDANRQAK